MTFVDFLEARLAEDEAKVEYMTREVNRVSTAPIYQSYPPNWLAGVDIFVSPGRWRAECAAKRKIIERHGHQTEQMIDGPMEACTECGDTDDRPREWPCGTLRLLASVYADHPDYREGWRP